MIPRANHRLISYSADLHIHSALSPCAENKMTPDEILKSVIRFGIDVFSITDHNSGFNCLAFETAARRKGILFIPGIELQSSEEIHLLGYFPDTHALEMFCSGIVKPGLMRGMKNDPMQFGNQIKIDASGDVVGEEEDMLSMPLILTIDELVDKIHDFHGIAVAAHIDRGFSVISQLGYIPPQLELDAVEVWDATKIEDIRSKYLKERDMNIISSSDTHYLDMMKEPGMKFWLRSGDITSCLNIIKGTGAGRITIREKARKRSRSGGDRPSRAAAGPSKGSWQNLYKQG